MSQGKAAECGNQWTAKCRLCVNHASLSVCQAVVRIHLLEAEELTAKDTVIKGIIDGKSDPYAVLRVGTQTFTSHTVDSNLNPQWREMYEVRERDD